MGEIIVEVPTRAHPHVLGSRIKKKYGIEEDYFYMDVWPLAPDPLFYIMDPDIAQQVTVEHVTPKHKGVSDFLVHLAGPGDLVSSDGAHWKKWRSIMNPGFSSGHLMTLVTGIVDDCFVFCQKIAEHAEKGEVFRLEEDATRLTVDIIGKVALDLNLNLGTQRGENEVVNAFREQVQLLPNEGMSDPLSMYYPRGIYRRWKNDRIMTAYVGKVLEEHFARRDETAVAPPGQKKQWKRAIVDLALDAYQAQLSGSEVEKGQSTSGAPVMDAEFKRMAITQIRTFIFAGHDTTSSTIAYAFYELQRNPECMKRIREEHDAILGPVDQTPQVIRDEPHILNKLEYTLSVIEETLRLWPAASSTRTGDPGFRIRDPKTGESYPTEGMLLWVVHYSLQRNPAVWGETANVFDPSRFLPENESKLPENGWRPFEKGPRNCIDELKNDGSYNAKDDRWRKGKQDLDGEEAYGVLIATAKPREGMPVGVKTVKTV